MVIYLPTALIFIYLLIRLVLPLKVGSKKKLALGMLLLVAAQGHLLKALAFGGLSSPELPPWILMIQGALFFGVLFLFLLVLSRDVFLLFRRLFRKRPAGDKDLSSPQRRRFLIKGLGAVPAAYGAKQALLASSLAVLPAAYGVSQAVAVPRLNEFDLTIKRLTPEHDGLSLVQVSDLHVSPLLTRDWVEKVVKKINAVQPDLILFTGDMVDGLPARRAESMAPLNDLKARYGTYACAGNHEYYNGFHQWMDFFSNLGLTMLLNDHRSLAIKGREIVLVGLTDPVAPNFALPGPNLAGALKGAPPEAVKVLLDHRPINAPTNALGHVDLQLSGHTHGGQMPLMSSLVTAANGGFLRGLYKVREMPLYVNSGAGLWNGFPVRLGVPAEIAHIVLRRPR